MIILTTKANLKLKHFALNVDGEISGLGKSEIVDCEHIVVEDIEIFPQESSAGSTELQSKALAKFLNEKMSKGEDISKWNIWWHSHGDIGVCWSQIDEDTIETFTGGQSFISIVVNKEMKMLGRIDFFKPFRFIAHLRVLKPRGNLKKGQEEEIIKYCKEKIKKCVKSSPIGFFGRPNYSIPKKYRKQSPSSEQEISEVQSPMGWRNWD